MMALARAATFLAALGATLAYATTLVMAPPGVPAKKSSSPQRPVAQIVSPSRSAEGQPRSLNEAGDIARLLELKLGMTVGDMVPQWLPHVRLSRSSARAGRLSRRTVTRLPHRARQADGTAEARNVMFAPREPHDPALPLSSLDAAILVHMYTR